MVTLWAAEDNGHKCMHENNSGVRDHSFAAAERAIHTALWGRKPIINNGTCAFTRHSSQTLFELDSHYIVESGTQLWQQMRHSYDKELHNAKLMES
jgi:hypothetical protein